ncbi:hypothetical protein [Hyalangium minutum]|uniref:Uncharacterized protein n=1 Tax=Hyalangium minutum TaxID=394096 RepID=A0A085WEF0_9BACT|nr:hypothetical protein [Hyalangium minutum]KFE66063.1 hypothetical protein DB31_1128 [Hyalangium minutum]
MKASPRFLLPLAGAAVLAVAVLAVLLWPEPSVPPSEEPPPVAAPVPVAEGTAATRAPQPPPRQPERAASAEPSVAAPAPEEPRRATVVPIQPGDIVPEPESPNPLPQVNDPIEPEKPQTARWKLGKTERITSLLEKDVARLEQEREAAGARGDSAERQRLDILIQRHKERVQKLKEEMQQLSLEAEREPPEQ